MDVLYFLQQRTKAIRRFYATAGDHFGETIRKIEAEEPPFVHLSIGEEGPESDEPPFLSEWIDADTGLELVGRSCLSMLSASLQLYFKEWERELRLSCRAGHAKSFKLGGFLHGYRACFGDALGIDWSKCPADLGTLEQITLARNLYEHPESISTFNLSHSKKDFTKYPRPFFGDEFPPGSYEDPDEMGDWWLGPRLRVSREKLFEAIDQVELLGKWVNEQVGAALRST